MANSKPATLAEVLAKYGVKVRETASGFTSKPKKTDHT